MADRTEEIRARAEKATPGPWTWHQSFELRRRPMWCLENPESSANGRTIGLHTLLWDLDVDAGHNADLQFIAHARSDIPYLLEENKRLRLKADALDRAHALLDRLGIPPAQGCVCDDPNCETHIEHRIHMLSDRAALTPSPDVEPSQKRDEDLGDKVTLP